MALSFQQLADLANDPVVRGRIRVAASRVAIPVTRELPSAVGGTGPWEKRMALAEAVLNLKPDQTGAAVLDLIVWGVIGVVDVAGAAPTDAQLQAYVLDIWNELAGVDATMVPNP